MHDRVVGIDEHVVRLESVEMKAKLDHAKYGQTKGKARQSGAGERTDQSPIGGESSHRKRTGGNRRR